MLPRRWQTSPSSMQISGEQPTKPQMGVKASVPLWQGCSPGAIPHLDVPDAWAAPGKVPRQQNSRAGPAPPACPCGNAAPPGQGSELLPPSIASGCTGSCWEERLPSLAARSALVLPLRMGEQVWGGSRRCCRILRIWDA